MNRTSYATHVSFFLLLLGPQDELSQLQQDTDSTNHSSRPDKWINNRRKIPVKYSNLTGSNKRLSMMGDSLPQNQEPDNSTFKLLSQSQLNDSTANLLTNDNLQNKTSNQFFPRAPVKFSRIIGPAELYDSKTFDMSVSGMNESFKRVKSKNDQKNAPVKIINSQKDYSIDQVKLVKSKNAMNIAPINGNPFSQSLEVPASVRNDLPSSSTHYVPSSTSSWYTEAMVSEISAEIQMASSSNEMVLGFFSSCPSFQQRLMSRTFCYNPRHSCKKSSCKAKGMLSYCHCDAICRYAGDCCWDYEMHCSSIHVGRHDFQVECVSGLTVITGCPQLGEEKASTPELQDIREPRVTYRKDGLTFKNKFVAKKCSFDSFNPIRVIEWDLNIYLPMNVNISVLKQFFKTGINFQNQLWITNIKSHNQIGRQCQWSSIQVKCLPGAPNSKDDYSCPDLLLAQNWRQICKGAFHEESLHNIEMHLVNDTNEEVSQLNHQASVTTPVTSYTSNEKISTTIATDNNQAFLDSDQGLGIGKRCQAKLMISEPAELPRPQDLRLAFRVNFGVKKHPKFINGLPDHIAYEGLNPFLKKMKCLPLEDYDGCDLIAVCKNGYMPIGLVCRETTHLVVQTVNKASSNINGVIQNNKYVLDIVGIQFLGLVIEDIGVLDADSFNKRGDFHFLTKSFPLDSSPKANKWINTYDGSNIKPSEFLTNNLRVVTGLIAIRVCVLLQPLAAHNRSLLCDMIQFFSSTGYIVTNHTLIEDETGALDMYSFDYVHLESDKVGKPSNAITTEVYVVCFFLSLMVCAANILTKP